MNAKQYKHHLNRIRHHRDTHSEITLGQYWKIIERNQPYVRTYWIDL